jgi:photosystem II stability/assembly factor-like uncharacterized protein
VSSDDGATWKSAYKLLDFDWVNDLVLKDGTIYANAFKYGVLKSKDNGTTWTPVNEGLPKDNYGLASIESLLIHDNKLYAVYGKFGMSIYFLDEATSKWNGTSCPRDVVTTAASNGSYFFVGGWVSMTLRKGSDFTWRNVKGGFPRKENHVISLRVDGNNIYAGIKEQGAFASHDNGESWSSINTGLPKGIEINQLTSNGASVYAATKTNEIYFSPDQGKTWKLLTNAPKEEVRSMAPLGNRIYFEGHDHLYYTDDNGETFIESDFDKIAAKASDDVEFYKRKAETIATKKIQMATMIYDSYNEFTFNMPASKKPAFQDGNTKYFYSTTKFKSDISLVREEIRDTASYRSLIYGWSLNDQTAQEDEEDAHWSGEAANEVIQEKMKTGSFKTFTIQNPDGSTSTLLRDSLGGPIMETVLDKKYFELIVYGKKCRTAPVKDMTGPFSIYNVLVAKNRKRTITSAYPFEFIGEKGKVSLYAALNNDNVIFAVDNPTQKTVSVKMKLALQCVEQGLSVSYQTVEIVWTITVPANSQKTYDTDQAACVVEGCKKKTNAWKILEWVVE